MITLYKNIGETPLECLERYRKTKPELKDIPMTYAGRLDPMAQGLLLILIGDECKEKEKYLGFDKVYDIEVLFGIKTDTGDVLGIISEVKTDKVNINNINLNKYKGSFEQSYPIYSSKTVNGEQLHTLARRGDLPDEIPTKSVEIYDIINLGQYDILGKDLSNNSISNINKVNGDFRQKEIIGKWENFKQQHGDITFQVIKLRVSCSSGTYMRSLAERIAKELGSIGIAISINRIRLGDFV